MQVHEKATTGELDLLTKVQTAAHKGFWGVKSGMCTWKLEAQLPMPLLLYSLLCLPLNLVTSASLIFLLLCFLQGDNNYSDDRGLYARGQEWLNKKHIMGRAVG
jgi:hypothetical protein